tara:strand:+ start:1195 stop:1407 length:213 start_codon:yes stop_codon:yes gene_type:complete
VLSQSPKKTSGVAQGISDWMSRILKTGQPRLKGVEFFGTKHVLIRDEIKIMVQTKLIGVFRTQYGLSISA